MDHRRATWSYRLELLEAFPIWIDALQARDVLAETALSDEERSELEELDAILLDEALAPEASNIHPSLLEDHPDKPLERWWWHLGKIQRGEYPLELLPDHLRRVVEEAREQ